MIEGIAITYVCVGTAYYLSLIRNPAYWHVTRKARIELGLAWCGLGLLMHATISITSWPYWLWRAVRREMSA